MKNKVLKFRFYYCLMTLLSCQLSLGQSVTYTESLEDFMNPDRGFYTPVDVNASNFIPLTVAELQGYRNTPYTPWQGNYTVRTSLIFRNYILDAFVNTNTISTAFLNGMQADFNAARTAGVRLIIRFSYNNTPTPGCGDNPCPPYGDAPKARVIAHLSQLAPYLQQHKDVIAVVQAGFIGLWGEHYYTDYFGDASVQGGLFNINWQDRADFLTALLSAVPNDRMIQVRYPQLKQKYLYGFAAPVTTLPVTAAQAHNGSNIARIAFHNDCFLSSPDDIGTYWDYGYGTTTTSSSNQTGILKPYLAKETIYVANGGETCGDGYNPQNNCSGGVVVIMDTLNISYINADYNNSVNNDWQDGGCMDEIKRRLGYRFVLKNGTFPATATQGGTLTFTLKVKNVGFAAPFNQRKLKLILRNTTTNQLFSMYLTGANMDTRFWLSGQTIILNPSVTLPGNIPSGNYDLLLHISDESSTAIANRPEFSIRLANTGTWEETTGFNKLNHTLSISATSTPPATPTGLIATATSASTITLSWTDNSNNETGFRVFRSLSASSGYTLIHTTTSNISTYVNTGLSPSTTYYYRIRAFNAAGNSGNSNTANATTSGNNTPSITVAAPEESRSAMVVKNDTFVFMVYPNPANDEVQLFYTVGDSDMEINIYSTTGNKIKSIVEKNPVPGPQQKALLLDDLSAGTYFIQIKNGGQVATKVLSVIK